MFQLRIATECTRNVKICTKTRSSIETQNTQKKIDPFWKLQCQDSSPKIDGFF